jgi:hypothetical protein
MSSEINLGKCLWEGCRTLIETHDAEDSEKCGSLRAGNAGMMDEDQDTGQLIAFGGSPSACPRRTYLRFLGIQERVDDRRVRIQRMFDGGVASENSFRRRLEAGLPEGYSTLKEEDTPIRWKTRAGIDVTGRPDLVVLNPEKVRLVGVENKRMSSLWTATKVVFKQLPKTDHLVQAGHYSWKLGIPYELWYSSGVNFALPKPYSYLPKKEDDTPLSKMLDYWEDGRASGISVAEIGYRLRWNSEGFLEWQQVSDQGEATQEEWTTSIVSQSRIQSFYEFVSRMQTEGVLGPRPESFSADGKEAEYSPCKYCELQAVCEKHEGKGLNRWMKEVLKSNLMVDKRPGK